jgi:hypothetical protein
MSFFVREHQNLVRHGTMTVCKVGTGGRWMFCAISGVVYGVAPGL